MSRQRSDDHWLTRPQSLRWLRIGCACILLATVGAQFFIPIPGSFALSGAFAFAAWFGFGACVALVLLARILGWLLERPETYYQQATQAGDADGEVERHD